MIWNREVEVVCVAAVLGMAGLFGEAAPFAGVEEEILVGAGSIAECESTGDEATAELLDSTRGAVFTVGDNFDGSSPPEEPDSCYASNWGQHETRTRPVPGDHDYAGGAGSSTGGAEDYFDYFGEMAGEPGKGYYSYELGGWHVVALNSMCDEVGGCDEDSPMLRWLERDLAANDKPCTLALWHHPLFSSGPNSNHISMWAAWDALYLAGADVVVNGHDRVYERFAPQTPEGNPAPNRGIREFVVGTGGASLDTFGESKPNSEARNSGTHGVLKFTLRPDGYEWEFLSAEGSAFSDSGSDDCH